MALWDVLSGCVLARLEDAAGYRDAVGGRQRSETYGVMGLAWVVQRSSVLAVLLAPATLLLWDTKGAYGLLWPPALLGLECCRVMQAHAGATSSWCACR